MWAAFEGKKVVIIGDVILDHYVFGRVDRVSPEAAVLVLQHERETYRLGGAANVALNIKALGAEPFLLTVVGDDMAAGQLRELLAVEKIATDYILVDSTRPTSLKTRFLARHQQLLRHDRESTTDISAELKARLLLILRQLVAEKGVDIIILQDYNKGVLGEELIVDILAYAKSLNLLTVIDPKKRNFDAYRGCTLFKPNLREVGEALGEDFQENNLNLAALSAAGRGLQARLGCDYLCITLGAQGMLLLAGEMATHVPTKMRAVADVCGAGDTVVSTLALALAAEMPILAAVRLANLAGGQVCEKIGVVAVDAAQLLEEWDDMR
jgi:D-glycero-beta-D-manno-heptose-7-phosphate kinase